MTLPEDTSIDLLPGIEASVVDGSFFLKSTMGNYSASLLKVRKPEVYNAAVELLGRDFSIEETSQILKLNPRSVAAILDRNPQAIAEVKQRVSRRFLDVATLSAEVARNRLLDDPDSISFKDLMIGGAVATDKHLILAGEATQRIEHVVRSGDDDFGRMLEDAKRRGKVIEGEIVETAPDMDMSGRDGGTKGGGRLGPGDQAAGGPDLAEGELVTGAGDIQSGVLDSKANVIEVLRVDVSGVASDAGPAAGALGGVGEAVDE